MHFVVTDDEPLDANGIPLVNNIPAVDLDDPMVLRHFMDITSPQHLAVRLKTMENLVYGIINAEPGPELDKNIKSAREYDRFYRSIQYGHALVEITPDSTETTRFLRLLRLMLAESPELVAAVIEQYDASRMAATPDDWSRWGKRLDDWRTRTGMKPGWDSEE